MVSAPVAGCQTKPVLTEEAALQVPGDNLLQMRPIGGLDHSKRDVELLRQSAQTAHRHGQLDASLVVVKGYREPVRPVPAELLEVAGYVSRRDVRFSVGHGFCTLTK